MRRGIGFATSSSCRTSAGCTRLSSGGTRAVHVAGTTTIDGDGLLAGARADDAAGTVARIGIAANGTLRAATLSLQAVATPFAEAPFASATADLGDVDAASFDASLPHTRARLHLAFAPQGAGIAGALELANDEPGPIETQQLPIAHWPRGSRSTRRRCSSTRSTRRSPDGGGARGDGRIALGAPNRSARFALTVAISTSHDSPRSSCDAPVGTANRRCDGGAADDRRRRSRSRPGTRVRGGRRDERIEVTRFRASTAAGSLEGSARMALNEPNEFTVQATMRRLDPSRFAAMPGASLDGTLKASGVLRPRWRASASVAIAPTSHLAGWRFPATPRGTSRRAAFATPRSMSRSRPRACTSQARRDRRRSTRDRARRAAHRRRSTAPAGIDAAPDRR